MWFMQHFLAYSFVYKDRFVFCNLLQAESAGVKFPESKGAGVYLRSGRVRTEIKSLFNS